MLPDSEGRVSIQRSHALQVTKERMQQELRGGGSQTKQELVSRVQSLPRPLTARDRKSAVRAAAAQPAWKAVL